MSIFKLLKLVLRPSRYPRPNQPTHAQVAFLQTLIKINNGYRAAPWTLQDWIQIYYKGKWDQWRAGKLIEKLQLENAEKKATFKEEMSERLDREDEGTLFASDFSSYGFCPNAFYLKFRGYANKNLYELCEGSYYHGDSAAEAEGQYSRRSQLLKSKVSRIESIKWFKTGESETIHNEKMNLSGIPDGMIMFEDKKLAIVEIKSRKTIENNTPYWGDILQACAYLHLCKTSGKTAPSRLSSRLFIIYLNREKKEQQLFEVNFDNYQGQFIAAYNKMKKVSFAKELFNSDKNEKKCPSCGYRTLCKKIVSKM